MTTDKAVLIFLLGPIAIIGAFFVIYYGSGPLAKRIKSTIARTFGVHANGASVLFAAFGSVGDLQNVTAKRVNGREIAAYHVTKPSMLFGMSGLKSGMLYQVGLHQTEPIHFVCFANKAAHKQRPWKATLRRSGFRKINLESTFPDDFQLYVQGGAVISLLEFFNPKTMAYFVDFCQNFDFEVIGTNIYAYQESFHHKQDSSSTPQDLFVLADMIEKALADFSASAHIAKKSHLG